MAATIGTLVGTLSVSENADSFDYNINGVSQVATGATADFTFAIVAHDAPGVPLPLDFLVSISNTTGVAQEISFTLDFDVTTQSAGDAISVSNILQIDDITPSLLPPALLLAGETALITVLDAVVPALSGWIYIGDASAYGTETRYVASAIPVPPGLVMLAGGVMLLGIRRRRG